MDALTDGFPNSDTMFEVSKNIFVMAIGSSITIC